MGPLRDGETREIVRKASDLLVRHEHRCWFFGDSIGFEGLLAASDLLDDLSYAGYVHGFLRAWATRAEPYRESDNTAPGHVMCLVYERTGDALVLDAALRLTQFLRSRRRVGGIFTTFERTPLSLPAGPSSLSPADAALLHDPGAGVFVDCLHFDPPFFAHLGALAEDQTLLDLGVEQALGYARLLQDDDTGLFHHFHLERTGRPHILGWTRGQGWALLGMLEVLAYADVEHPQRAELIERSQRLAAALLQHQRPDGHWYAVAQEPASGEESTGAAFGACQFFRGMQLGVLDRRDYAEPAKRAFAAALERVDDNGKLTVVSAAVGACTQPSHYHHVSVGHTVPWGQGPLILAIGHREEGAKTRQSQSAREMGGSARRASP